MYQLKRNTTEGVFESSDGKDEKSQSDVYLFNSQWQQLEEIAEKENKSRNQVLREVLKDYFGGNQ